MYYWCTAMLLGVAPAWGQFDSGSDGSDGAFSLQADTVIDLSLASTASWDTPSPDSGKGVYDADQWAVVFKYTTINVPAGVTVTFQNHPSGAPVVWLASGGVTISGTVSVAGEPGSDRLDPPSFAEPGPGGFAGGQEGEDSADLRGSGGFGPGGGSAGTGAGGGHATAGVAGDSAMIPVAPGGEIYGNVFIVPLIGGSGGGGYGYAPILERGGGGGAGGGAILIASSGSITANSGSVITASGGRGGFAHGGGGSGGSIRLIANSVSGPGQLRAEGGLRGAYRGGDGGLGRIRVDADTVTLTDPGVPAWTTDHTSKAVWPSPTAPTLRATVVDGEGAPVDPIARILTTDLQINNAAPVTIQIEATDIPAGTTVEVRIVPARGDVVTVTSTQLSAGQGGVLTATAQTVMPSGRAEIQLRANWTP